MVACRAGIGVGVFPQGLVSADVESGRLVPCLTPWECGLNEQLRCVVYALYKPETFPNPQVRVFLDYLLDHTVSAGGWRVPGLSWYPDSRL